MSANWQSFNIAPSETVNFQQPNTAAIAVNRIADTNGTQIFGHLNANGQVYLINPNGILFGQGAQVNVGGLVASTLDVNDASLTAPSRTFSGSGAGSVVNQGRITAADGGSVALLGNTVSNQGVITAQLGTVALGAGSAATLTFNGNNLVKMQIDQSVLNNLAENKQLIQADGGQVIMSAGAQNALLASVVNNEGVIEARTLENHNGAITLLGGMAAGTVNVGGTLDAGAPGSGNGGFIETSAAHVHVADDANVTTLAANGHSGTWLIDPVDFTVAASGGDMTGAAVSRALAGGDFTIQSTSGSAGTSGNINVNDTVSWSANTFTLNAQNNININAVMNGSGTAKLALEYGQGAVAASNTSTYNVNAPVNLAAGNNFSTKLGSDGAVKNYTVVTDLGAEGSGTGTDLQGMNGNPTGNYVLGGNIDASATSGWNSGAGFMPIGSDPVNNVFAGAFDGLGHSISNLTINRPTTDYVGLFGATAAASSIRNVGLVGGSVSGNNNVGGLVGINAGTVGTSYAGGRVSGTSTAGGLVASNSGTVSNSFWDTQTSGQSTSAGGTGMSTADMQRQANFTSATAANGNANPNWDFANTWVMYDGLTAPLLRAFMTPLTVTANGGSKVYDGVAGNGVTYSVTPNSNLLGTLDYGVSKNVGNYTTALSGLYSNQQGYIVSYANSAITITPKPLNITGVTAANKVYDGSTAAPLGGTAMVGALAGDEVSVGGTGTGVFADASVDTGKAVTVSGFTLSGKDAGNYTAVQPAGLTADIVASKALDSGLSIIATMTSTPPPSAEDSKAEIKPDDKKESKEDSKKDSDSKNSKKDSREESNAGADTKTDAEAKQQKDSKSGKPSKDRPGAETKD